MCAGVVVFAHAGVKVRVSSRRNGHFRFRASNLACRGSSCLIWPLSSVFKNEENARTIRSKSSKASGRRAKTPHVRFVLCFTARTGLRAQNPRVFIGFREAVPGPPKRPPKRLPGAKTPKPPGQGPQAPRPGPPRRPRCVCYCVLQSELASGLKHLRFSNGFRPFRGFQEAPSGPPACPRRATAVSQARHKRVTGVPQFSFQRVTSVSEARQRRATTVPQTCPRRATTQLSAVSCQLSAVSCQLPAWPLAIGHWSLVISH